MLKKRIRTWNSELASSLFSLIRDRSEQRVFQAVFAQNELDERDLRFLASTWSNEKMDTESLCHYLVRVGWLAQNVTAKAEHTHLPDEDEIELNCRLSTAAKMEIESSSRSFLRKLIGWPTHFSLRRRPFTFRRTSESLLPM